MYYVLAHDTCNMLYPPFPIPSFQFPPLIPLYCHTLDHKSSPVFAFGAGSCLSGAAGIGAAARAGAGAGAGSDGADPQSPKSSSAAIFGGAGAAEPNPPKPLSAPDGDAEPQPPESVDAALLENPGEEPQSGWAFNVLGTGAVGDLPQSLFVGAEVVGRGELPQPKSAPVTETFDGLVTEMPV